MESGVVYDGVVRQSEDGYEAPQNDQIPRLFSGLKLWFSHSVPQRKWLMENAQANGAVIVPLEQQADVRLVDHTRKNQAPGTHSYRFIEDSIRKGQLEDLDFHRVGSTARVDRPVGSIVTGPKGSRAAYTEEEDQFLYDFVQPFREKGGSWKGNEIYKQIERVNPRHTYQSWRDRFIKHVQYQGRTVTAAVQSSGGTRHDPPTQEAEPPRLSLKRPSPSREQTPDKRQRLSNSVYAPDARRKHPVPSQRSESAPQHSDPDKTTHSHRTLQSTAPELTGSRAKEAAGPSDQPLVSDNSSQTALQNLIAKTSANNISPSKLDGANDAPTNSKSSPRRKHRASNPLLTPESQRATSMTPDDERAAVQIPDNLPPGFERKHFRKFFRITMHILDTSANGIDIVAAFDAVASEYKTGHSGHEWRVFWQTIVLPVWLQRIGQTVDDLDPSVLLRESDLPEALVAQSAALEEQVNQQSTDDELSTISCSQCLTKDSVKWKRSRQGKIFCMDCDKLLKQARMRSLSGANTLLPPMTQANNHSNADVLEREPVLSEPKAQTTLATPTRNHKYSDAMVQTSPIEPPAPLEKLPPDMEDDLLRAEPPGPNQSRKRSAGRTSQSTSQETNKDSEKASHDRIAAIGELTPQDQDNVRELEIPSTPDAAAPFEYESPHRPPLRELPIPSRESTPFFEPQGNEEPELPPSRDRAGSSPLNVRLVDDEHRTERYIAPTSSHSDKENDTPSSEYGDFEDKPDLSQDWETAPEQQQHTHEQQLSTQAISPVVDHEQEATSFDLPAPEGGWEALGVPEVDDDELQAIAETPEVVETSSDHGEEMDIDTWLAIQRDQHTGVKGLEPMLATAIQSTCMKFALAGEVVHRMVEFSKTQGGRRLRRQGKVPLPDDIPGCWTETDDELLHSAADQDLDIVKEKHGTEACETRLDFLEAYESA